MENQLETEVETGIVGLKIFDLGVKATYPPTH